MKYHVFVEPLYGCDHITVMVYLTEQQILDFYWEFWKGKMEYLGRHDRISEDGCVEDFLISSWSHAVDKEEFEQMKIPVGTVVMDYKLWRNYLEEVKANMDV